jgi:glucose/arabinose dehydrogenase
MTFVKKISVFSEKAQPFLSLFVELLSNRKQTMMKKAFIFCTLIIMGGLHTKIQAQIFIGSTEVDTSTIVTDLDTPWEILWGPDEHIWFTERHGRISRVDPGTGTLNELITIVEVYEESESGLMAMVLHPDFSSHPYVYVVYTYLESSSIKERLVRFTYTNGILGSPLILIDGIPGANRHDGSRLVIDKDLKIYMTTGDATERSRAQDLNSLNGKVLRLNLDGSVPDDNPISGSYVWSWGHRNAQGLVISPAGIMYSSEHGPSNDDELNIIEKGRNYGWPTVEGFCNSATESQFCADSNVFEPIAAWTPTLAVAGTDFYSVGVIPEWQNSLLVTSLKASQLTALQLSQDGRTVVQEESFFQSWFGRLRDVCVSPDGRIFLAVSNRDGRGSARAGDDRIVEIAAVNSDMYCYASKNVFICQGDSYDFYGVPISQPGTYVDTIAQVGPCDSIVSVLLHVREIEDIGVEDTVTVALDATVTLIANEGFISYTWNKGVPTQDNSVLINASEFGEGVHDYIVEVETTSGCMQSDTIKLIVSSTVGIGESRELNFSVYPNPSGSEGLHIDYAIDAEAVLMVFDQLGREVSRMKLFPAETHAKIYLPEESGLYNLVLVNRNGTGSLKVLRQ